MKGCVQRTYWEHDIPFNVRIVEMEQHGAAETLREKLVQFSGMSCALHEPQQSQQREQ